MSVRCNQIDVQTHILSYFIHKYIHMIALTRKYYGIVILLGIDCYSVVIFNEV